MGLLTLFRRKILPTPVFIPIPFPVPILRKAHGVWPTADAAHTAWVQSALNVINLQLPDRPTIKVDGILGPKTLAAVRDFKRRHGMLADANVSPSTEEAISKALKDAYYG